MDCQYAELAFQTPTSDSEKLLHNQKVQPTIYAQIDYSEMALAGHRAVSSGGGSGGPRYPGSQVTSMLAPFLPSDQPQQQFPGSRSGTLKRVQFLDEATTSPAPRVDKHKTGSLPRNSGRKSAHLCPLHSQHGTLPRTYVTQGDIDQIQTSVVHCNALTGDGGSNVPCSPVKDVESNL